MKKSNARKLYCYNLDGSLKKEYASSHDATADLGSFNFIRAIGFKKDGVPFSAMGFHWSWIKYKNILTKERAELHKKKKQPPIDVVCSSCGSHNVIKCGINYCTNATDKQKYKCKDCGQYTHIGMGNLTKKRMVIISDTHCGHKTGLTPPEFNFEQSDDKFFQYRKRCWDWFVRTLESLKPIDILICNGDLIDGRGDKNGGNELIVRQRDQQVKMAVRCIEQAEADKIYISKGTAYHSGKIEDWENQISEFIGGEICNVIKINVNGCKINARHKTSRSSIPHGRYTQLALAALWEDLKVAGTDDGKVNVIIRSHVHYASFIGSGNNRLAFTTPALQGASDFGEKECSGIVDYGITLVDINKNGVVDKFKFILTNQDENHNVYKDACE